MSSMPFMLVLSMQLGFDCWWVILSWVLPCCWLTGGYFMHHVLSAVVQVLPDHLCQSWLCMSEVICFSLAIAQLSVLGASYTIELQFQTGPGRGSV